MGDSDAVVSTKVGRRKRRRASVVAAALLIVLVSSAAWAATWTNQSSVVIELEVQALFSKWRITMTPSSSAVANQLWVKVNGVRRLERLGTMTTVRDLRSTNCIGVYGERSRYKVEGDKNHVTCTKE